MLRPLPLLAALCFPAAIQAQTSLAWKFADKERFYAEWHWLTLEKNRVGGNMVDVMFRFRYVARYTVEKNDPEGIMLRMKIGAIEAVSPAKIPARPWGPLEGADLLLSLDRNLRIAKIEGLELLVGGKAGEHWTLPQQHSLQYLERTLCTLHDRIFLPLPDNKVAVKDAWSQDGCPLGSRNALEDRTLTYSGPEKENDRRHRLALASRARPIGDPLRPNLPDLKVTRERYRGSAVFDAAWGKVVLAESESLLELSCRQTLPTGRPGPGTVQEGQDRWVVRLTRDDPTEDRRNTIVQAAHVETGPMEFPKEWKNSLGMEMVGLPAGKFTMGDAGFGKTEKTRRVEISRPFAMSAHEVTIGQYRQFVEATGYRTLAERNGRGAYGLNKESGKLEFNPRFSWKHPGWDHDDDHPAVNLAWEDAKAFCAWLAKKEGKPYRLPTEAEWEYACRAGTTTAYSGGDDAACLAKLANILDRSGGTFFPPFFRKADYDDGYPFTAPVGSFAPNAFGLYDMHGNAAEWCEDWYFNYPEGPGRDPLGPPFGLLRVQRGGGFPESPHQATSAQRAWTQGYHVSSGFRVVVSAMTLPEFTPDPTWIGRRVMPADAEQMTGLNRHRPVSYPITVAEVRDERLGGLYLSLPGMQGWQEKEDVVLLEDAVGVYTAALEKTKTPTLYVLRATAYRHLGKGNEAVRDLDRAMELDENNPWLLELRAGFRWANKDFAGASKDLHAALALRDDNLHLQTSLALFLATCPADAQRDGKKALHHAKIALDRSPVPSGLQHEAMAAAHAELGDFEEAVRCQTRANELFELGRQLDDRHRRRLASYRMRQPYRHMPHYD